MNRVRWLPILGLAGWLAMASLAHGQARPYIGYVYPAGGQQGTTFLVKLGGQGLNDVDRAIVTGAGVTAKVNTYFPKLGPQEMTLLREQLNELRRELKQSGKAGKAVEMDAGMDAEMDAMMPGGNAKGTKSGASQTVLGALGATKKDPRQGFVERIQRRMTEYVNRPASASISSLVFAEVTIAPDAEPGPRELRLVTPRGVSNPLVFHVGQFPETTRKAMITSDFQVLGKEELAQRTRPDDEVEVRVSVPCTMNGQIASGEVNRYRFEAQKGQRLVVSVAARQLIPYIADAVPGWFQPVLALSDAKGKELAYNDDFRFKPDPTLYFEVPEDGEYVLTITDAIYRGREDFVYRLTIGQQPMITSLFPLGARAGSPFSVRMEGWNLDGAELKSLPKDAGPGVYQLTASKEGIASNRMPFALDTLPETVEKEANNNVAHAQKVNLPIIVNGRIQRADDWDVFEITGRAGETIVAEVTARRLESPLDSFLKVTDATGKVLAFNDDNQDAGSGVNTHHADSHLMVTLPADGSYFVHLGDTTRSGGTEYAYRLRISAPRPDFALRLVPSSIAMRSRSTATVNVYAIRKDGFTGDIKLSLKDAPDGFSARPVTLSSQQNMTRLTVKTTLVSTEQPVALRVEGRATVGQQVVAREAVPAEDRMQAFLWRHLVPAEEFPALVYDPSSKAPPKRVPPPMVEKKEPVAKEKSAAKPAMFTKRQVAGRLRQLKLLYEEWLLTDDFYNRKVAECEATMAD